MIKNPKTQIKSRTYYYIESEDKELLDWECGHYSSWEAAIESIVRNKMYGSQKFQYIDWDDEEEFQYFNKVENRFVKLLKYYLNPDKK